MASMCRFRRDNEHCLIHSQKHANQRLNHSQKHANQRLIHSQKYLLNSLREATILLRQRKRRYLIAGKI